MLFTGRFSLCFLLAGFALSSPQSLRSSYTHELKESHIVPRGWTQVARAPSDHWLDMSIALKQGNFAELERHIYEVSDPHHHRYGQHLTKTEVEKLVEPSSESLSLVHEWLHQYGLNDLTYSAAKDWIYVSLPVGVVELLLNAKYNVFQHEDGTTLLRATNWSLPLHLHDHIETIAPVNTFLRDFQRLSAARVEREPQRRLSPEFVAPAVVASNQSSIADVTAVSDLCKPPLTPTCLRTLYGTINYKPKVPENNSVGLTNYLGESSNRSDVRIFLENFRPEAAPYAKKFIVEVINDGSDQQTPDTPGQRRSGIDQEADFDTEGIISFAWPTRTIVYTTGGRAKAFKPDKYTPHNSNEPYLEWLKFVLSQSDSDIAKVISTSYGDDEETVPPSFARTVCNQFAQLAARGITFLIAAGDVGVGENGTCYSNDGNNTQMFIPEWPPTCPYVTAVGATKGVQPEVVARHDKFGYYGGAGFSNYFPRPSYQNNTLATYLQSLGPNYRYHNLYNASGRAYPDIAAQGSDVAFVWEGRVSHFYGTSASTPIAAGVIALVNDALIAAGKSPLGFLNPWLYSGAGAQAFNDIVSGSSVGCETAGFPAQAGWDAASGWGTPNFTKLLSTLGL